MPREARAWPAAQAVSHRDFVGAQARKEAARWMAQEDDSLIREVQEEIRREKLENAWKKYGVLILGAAFAVVLGVGGYKGWQHYERTAAERSGDRYSEAMKLASTGKTAESEKLLAALAKEGRGGYRQLAQMRLAGDLAAAGKTADAVAAFDKVAADGGGDQILRDLARLKAALLRVDAADWTEMQNRLNALNNDKNVWRFSARELLGLAAVKAGKTAEARKLFETLLTDRGTPQAMRQRANMMLAMIGESSPAKPATPPAKAPPPAQPKAK